MDTEAHYKILLIEDDLFLSDLYKMELDKHGLPTVVARNGTTGIKKAQEFPYDLVLLDVMLPDMNGIEVFQALLKDEKTKHIPVIFCSNMGQDSIVKQAMSLGAVGYLIKASFSPLQIVEEVKRLLKEHNTHLS